MKSESKNRWMIWVIVFLALMNISTFLTIMLERKNVENEDLAVTSEKNLSYDNPVKYSGRYFRDQLKLSADQMNRFSQFNPGFRQQVRSINLELDNIRNEMFREMSAKNCDTSRLNVLSDSVGILHASLKKVTFRYYLEMKRICNDKQQENLEQLFSEIFTTDTNLGQHGKRGPQSTRRGRRFNN